MTLAPITAFADTSQDAENLVLSQTRSRVIAGFQTIHCIAENERRAHMRRALEMIAAKHPGLQKRRVKRLRVVPFRGTVPRRVS